MPRQTSSPFKKRPYIRRAGNPDWENLKPPNGFQLPTLEGRALRDFGIRKGWSMAQRTINEKTIFVWRDK